MIRRLMAAVLLAGVAAVATAQDATVRFNDRVAKKKEEEIKGQILEESPAGIKIKGRVGREKETVTKLIATRDILRVEYKSEAVDVLTYKQPFSKEVAGRLATGKTRAKLLDEALQGYTKLEAALKDTPNPRRYLQFKIAEVTAVMAQDDVGKRDDAIKRLTDFKTNNPSAWTVVPALKTLAKLLEDAGQTDDARKAYEELAAMPEVPPDLKQESQILVGRLLMRGGKFADAQTRLEKLAGTLSDGDLQKPFVLAYVAESKIGQNKFDGVQKELDAVIKGSSDGKLRGVAYNLLGDLHRKSGRLDDAFWAYLRVDALYHDDIDEQAKALYHLADLFDKVKKDPARGKDCLRRLRDKRFVGTAFQKKLPPEKDETETKKDKD
jgi:tetratricopeptide (TPR) repeat protein